MSDFLSHLVGTAPTRRTMPTLPPVFPPAARAAGLDVVAPLRPAAPPAAAPAARFSPSVPPPPTGVDLLVVAPQEVDERESGVARRDDVVEAPRRVEAPRWTPLPLPTPGVERTETIARVEPETGPARTAESHPVAGPAAVPALPVPLPVPPSHPDTPGRAPRAPVADPVVSIVIGRLELKATPPEKATPSAPRRRGSTPTLDAYLSGRRT